MELDSSLQIATDMLHLKKFDAMIAVSGYESRSSYLISKIDVQSILFKLVLAFNEKNDFLYREINDQKYREMGFTFIKGSVFEASAINAFLDQICLSINKKEIDILIDYSAMPKVWYSEILNFFNEKDDLLQKVNLWFAYAPSEFSKSISAISNKYLDPIKPAVKYAKPLALILGLGYEKGRAEDFAKIFGAELTFAFYANTNADSRYEQEVIANNKNILKSLNNDNIISYQIDNLNSVNEALTQLCIDLRLNYQVLLVPVGPKPFSLMCFVLAARYPDIQICKVSSVIQPNATDHRPNGELLVYKVILSNEEVDY
jgi:hypothetical protein